MKKRKVIIKGGRLVDEKGVSAEDILIEGSKIIRRGPSLSPVGNLKEINAESKLIFPGLIDPHVHFELKAYNSSSCDDFFTGSCAAAAGGVTTFIDFAIPGEGQTMAERIVEKSEAASLKSIVDFSFHAQITDWVKKSSGQMEEVLKEGVRSFKVFMPSTQGWGVDDYGLFEALRFSAEKKALVMVHAESGIISSKISGDFIQRGKTRISDYPLSRPDVIEREAVSRASILAREAGAPLYVCHLSGAKAARDIRRLKLEGEDIFSETCPHYLLLNNSVYKEKNGYLFACAPVLRSKKDNNELWRGLMEETIDTVGTDHCPFTVSQKKEGNGDFRTTPMGLGGVELSLPLLYSRGFLKRKIPLERIAALTSHNPAKIFGLYPQKGSLAEGSDADMVIFDPAKKIKLKSSLMVSSCDWSPYEGIELTGFPSMTFSRGEIIYSNFKINGKKGRGKFLKRKEFNASCC